MKWSFSSLKQYINCPHQYHQVKVLQRHPQKVTQQMLYGTEVHKALEEYARDNTELPANYRTFKPSVDALLDIPGKRYIEHQMALDANKQPCAFDSPDYWVRGIADLMIIDDDRAFIVDYKTGSNKYPDLKQLKLMALMAFAHFPEVKSVHAGLLFVVHNSFISVDYSASDAESYWGAFTPDLTRLE